MSQCITLSLENINNNQNAFKLKYNKINSQLNIKRLKTFIKFDQNYNDDIRIKLYCNNIEMKNDKNLGFYNIIDDNNLIKFEIINNECKDDIKMDEYTTNNDISKIIILTHKERIHLKKLYDNMQMHKYVMSNEYINATKKKRNIVNNELKTQIESVKDVLKIQQSVLMNRIQSWCDGYIKNINDIRAYINGEIVRLKSVNNSCLSIIKKNRVKPINSDSNNDNNNNINIYTVVENALRSSNIKSIPKNVPEIITELDVIVSKVKTYLYFKDKSKIEIMTRKIGKKKVHPLLYKNIKKLEHEMRKNRLNKIIKGRKDIETLYNNGMLKYKHVANSLQSRVEALEYQIKVSHIFARFNSISKCNK